MKHTYQICLAVILVAFGVLLIVAAFIVPPTGVIDPTVLTAFGEILTFSGSLIGIDYHYRYNPKKYENNNTVDHSLLCREAQPDEQCQAD